ncbi:hypothetical protein ABZP36_034197 [Zizania latifolia]
MAWEESQKHFLGLSYHELQSLCKQHSLPANKSHSQLASLLASFLEKGNINAAPERKTQASLLASPLLLSNAKEASTRCQDNHKRGTNIDRDDDGDRHVSHAKHHKGPQIPMDETLKSDSGTRLSFPPASIKNGKAGCFIHSSTVQGIASNVQSQNAGCIGKNSTAQVDDKISPESSYLAPNVGENVTDNGGGSSDKISENAHSSFQFFVMSDEGLDLFVDLNSTPSTLIQSMKEQVFIAPSTYHSEPVTKDSINNSISSSVEIQNKRAGSVAPLTNSSPGSTGGGVPVSSSCLTSDIQNISHMTANALNDKVLPQDSVDFSICLERNHASLANVSVHATGNKGHVVRSDSDEMINVLDGAQLAHNGNNHKVRLENEPVEVVPVDEDIGCHDKLSISCQLGRQTVAKLPVTDAQLEASSADRFIAGSFKLTNTTPSPAALDNAFSSKHDAESAQGHDSAYKKICDPDELEEFERKIQPSPEPPRNKLRSLRSASARQTKPATSTRRSVRRVPKVSRK